MAFLVHSTDDHRVPILEYLPCGAIRPQVGMMMTTDTNGHLIPATEKEPKYICMCSEPTARTVAGLPVAVVRFRHDMIVEAPVDLNGTASAPPIGAVAFRVSGRTDNGGEGMVADVGSNGKWLEVVEYIKENGNIVAGRFRLANVPGATT